MLIGPQNSSLHVNHVRSRILRAAAAAGRDPAAVTLVAVTKAQTAETVRVAATAGVTDFGENYLKEALAKMDARKSRVIELRFFGGLSVEETAEVLAVSPETVMRDWKFSRAWLMDAVRG